MLLPNAPAADATVEQPVRPGVTSPSSIILPPRPHDEPTTSASLPSRDPAIVHRPSPPSPPALAFLPATPPARVTVDDVHATELRPAAPSSPLAPGAPAAPAAPWAP